MTSREFQRVEKCLPGLPMVTTTREKLTCRIYRPGNTFGKNMADNDLNWVERTYKNANSITYLTMSLDDWMVIGIPFLSMVVPHATGLPEKYATPILLFVLSSAWMAFKDRDQKDRARFFKRMLWTGVACLSLFLILR